MLETCFSNATNHYTCQDLWTDLFMLTVGPLMVWQMRSLDRYNWYFKHISPVGKGGGGNEWSWQTILVHLCQHKVCSLLSYDKTQEPEFLPNLMNFLSLSTAQSCRDSAHKPIAFKACTKRQSSLTLWFTNCSFLQSFTSQNIPCLSSHLFLTECVDQLQPFCVEGGNPTSVHSKVTYTWMLCIPCSLGSRILCYSVGSLRNLLVCFISCLPVTNKNTMFWLAVHPPIHGCSWQDASMMQVDWGGGGILSH